MPDIYVVLYLVYVTCGVGGALMLLKKGPRTLLFWSVVFILYSTLPTIGMIIDGKSLNNTTLEIVGRSLLVFFSVVGGALFSTAWKELREKRGNEKNA